MGGVYFVSDLRLDHGKVADLRGFTSVADHDAAVLNSLAALRREDQLWILGDLAVTSNLERLQSVLRRLRATTNAAMHLVPGNHDPVHPMFRQAHRFADIYGGTFQSIQAFARRKVAGQPVLLSHFPYDGEGHRGGPGRHTQYRLVDEGLPLIHGHTHDTWCRSRSATGTLQMNVGWDFQRGPVPLSLLELFVADPGVDFRDQSVADA